jgi:DNA-binding transcriptional ArsR family regulator
VSSGTAADTDAVFGALADPTRRGVLRLVASAGPVTATELATQLPVTRQAITKHLGVLGDAGLVDATREGRETRYRAQLEPLDAVTSWIGEVGTAWDDRLHRLRRHLHDR